MKILHTSDWHLGRDFGPVSLHGDQAAFVDWLVDEVGRRGIDLVVIAGDIYDRAYAPNDAVVLFRTALRRLLAAGAKVAAITGNHDAADRVANYGDMLDGGRLFVRGGYEAIGEVITADFHDGTLDLVMLPFLDPQAAPDWLGVDDESAGEDGADAEAGDGAQVDDVSAIATASLRRRAARTHQSVLATAVEAVSGKLQSGRSLAVAHAFVAGCTTTDSERQLTVGGAGTVDAAIFEPFSYTALGHLHRPQRVGTGNVFYSGTPLAYSFSEEHPKSVCCVEMGPDGACSVEIVPVPVGRRVATISGTIEELLDPSSHPDAVDAWVRAIVTNRETVLHARARLETLYPHLVETLQQPDGRERSEFTVPEVDTNLSPLELALEFWRAAEGDDAPSEIRDELVESLESAVSAAEAAAR